MRGCVARSHFGMSSKICVYTFSGMLLTFDGVEVGSLSAWDLKQRIKEVLGVPRRLQTLVEGTRVFGNHETISQECTPTLIVDNSCFICGSDASKSCSRCFSICYCSEVCQSSDWMRHKPRCVRIGKVSKKKYSMARAMHLCIKKRLIWCKMGFR